MDAAAAPVSQVLNELQTAFTEADAELEVAVARVSGSDEPPMSARSGASLSWITAVATSQPIASFLNHGGR